MENSSLYQRPGHTYEDYGLEDIDDDISYSSGNDSESDYGGDREDNDDYPDEKVVILDPGHFRYNRKMFLVSLPCAVMVLTLVGEIFLMAASFGAGVIMILDPKGERKRKLEGLGKSRGPWCHKQMFQACIWMFSSMLVGKLEGLGKSRGPWCHKQMFQACIWMFSSMLVGCMIFFTVLFIFCHGFTIYSILPLLWLSVFNLFLIGVINMYVILTGGLCAMQFAYFRKFETSLAMTIEKMLFSIYPWCCVILLTWTASSLVHWELLPYIFLSLGFIYLQTFMTPHTTSFRVQRTEDEILHVVPESISMAMAILYCFTPAISHVILHLINNPFSHIFKFTFFLHLIFILSLSVFLTTLMSLRSIFEFMGWLYTYIVYSRWACGALCTALIYPVLMHYQLTSHFLPWLPLGVAVYAIYGAILSEKKFKTLSLLLLPVPCLLFTYWLTWLPWRLDSLLGIPMQTLYVLLLSNCVLCFLCVYSATYWRESLYELFLVSECTVFTVCEVLLYQGSLYRQSFLILTAGVILYTLHRLHSSGKLSNIATMVCSSIHVTKALAIVIYHVVGTDDKLTPYRCITLFILCLIITKVITEDARGIHTLKDVLYNMGALSLAIMLNTNPILHILCIYVLWEEPTQSDILGLCMATCGASIIVVGSLQSPPESVTAVRQMGVVSVSLGVLILVLQPTLSLAWSSVLQWGDVGSVILVSVVLLTGRVTNLQSLLVCAAVASLCPGIRMATLMYPESVDTPIYVLIGRCALYIPSFACLLSLLFMFIKLEVQGSRMEKYILSLCCSLGLLSLLLLFIDIAGRDESEGVMSLPAWKLSLVTTGVVSVSLKILSLTQDLLIPLVKDKKEKETIIPRLPLIGNVMSILTFLLACVQSPARGLLHDIWCCGASLILICLQKDKRLFSNLKSENHVVPTIFTSITILYVSSIFHSDLWTATSLSFLRALIELSTMLAVIPQFYILWGILWKGSLIMSEQLAVFLLPLNAVYLLYGSSFTSQALGVVGLYAGVWMIATKLPLIPYTPEKR